MCWCLRVYATVLHNLLRRFLTNFSDWFYNCACCCCRCCCPCCCTIADDVYDAKEANSQILHDLESGDQRSQSAQNIQHDYVIVDELDADYLEISRRKIETESYYLLVDRFQAEDILSVGYPDGACLVRPYKEVDIAIKYIVSIYAQRQYFHLFVRQVGGRELYGIGQEKRQERLFRAPSDIIEFYSCNALQCTNKETTLSILLKPIVA